MIIQKITSNLFSILLMTLLYLYSVPLLAFETIPLTVILNTSDRGEYFLLMSDDGDVYFPVKDLQSLGIRQINPTARIDDEYYVSLYSLRSQLRFTVDQEALALRIDVDPSMLDKTVIDISEREVDEMNPFGIDTAFFNYGVNLRGGEGQDVTVLEAPIESVVSAHKLLVRSNFLFHRDDIGSYWTRGMINVTKDMPSTMGRLVVGDFVANSGELGSGGIFGGISFTRNFGMSPYFSKTPGLTVSGLLEVPATVSVYINDVLIRSEDLPAGAFELTNLPNAHGAGVADVVMRDGFGRVIRKQFPYYISSNVLKKGVHDFSYNIGLQRDGLNTIAPIYKDPTVIGFHHYGVTDSFLAGFRFEGESDVINLGPAFNTLLGSWGEVEGGAAYSNARQTSGYSGFFRYFYASRYFHARLSWRGSSRFYANLALLPEQEKLKSATTVSIGTHGSRIGGLSVSYTRTLRYTESQLATSLAMKSEQVSVSYSRRLFRRLSILLRATRTKDIESTRDSFVATLNGTFGGRTSAGITHNSQRDTFVNRLFVQKNAPVGPGWGFNARIQENDESRRQNKVMSTGTLQYKSQIGVMTGTYDDSLAFNSYRVGMAGSLAFIGDNFYLTRPIQDSFALVKIDRLDDVRVYYSGGLVGKTSNGKMIVPNLVSYGPNAISIDVQDVPVDYSLASIRNIVSPGFRTGGITEFVAKQFKAHVGYIFIVDKGERKEAQYAIIKLRKGEEIFESIVGNGGEFYFEDLTQGVYQVELEFKGKTCQTDIEIPKGDDVLMDLGEITCEI